MLDGNIGLIRIESFSTNVDQEFSQKLQQLLDEGAQGLVFDVRFNPGGFVGVLVNMLDELLPKGTIISIADKDGNSTNYTSDEEQVELPMASADQRIFHQRGGVLCRLPAGIRRGHCSGGTYLGQGLCPKPDPPFPTAGR